MRERVKGQKSWMCSYVELETKNEIDIHALVRAFAYNHLWVYGQVRTFALTKRLLIYRKLL